jgi:hypothetical protein
MLQVCYLVKNLAGGTEEEEEFMSGKEHSEILEG